MARISLLGSVLAMAGCGWFDRREDDTAFVPPGNAEAAQRNIEQEIYGRDGKPTSTIWDIFSEREDAGRVGAVNRYIWDASLDVLDFLPVESVDPFTGVIATGFGTPPGGGQSYRATIYVSDPALDARSLNVALMTRAGPVAGSTTRAVEDAILTRARQLRAQDGDL
ncbi:hypothetical protein C357_10037 [Citreicella sp. 357]|nr:hypothetical protein C357_10037 [Citreicella sp. 357]